MKVSLPGIIRSVLDDLQAYEDGRKEAVAHIKAIGYDDPERFLSEVPDPDQYRWPGPRLKTAEIHRSMLAGHLLKHLKQLRDRTMQGDLSALDDFFGLYVWQDGVTYARPRPTQFRELSNQEIKDALLGEGVYDTSIVTTVTSSGAPHHADRCPCREEGACRCVCHFCHDIVVERFETAGATLQRWRDEGIDIPETDGITRVAWATAWAKEPALDCITKARLAVERMQERERAEARR